jgi:glycosyltransferase involved in cell wall biosynthesis
MTDRLVYLSASRLPSTAANAVHVAQMCDAFVGLGLDVTLFANRGDGLSLREHYGISREVPMREASGPGYKLWLAGRSLRRGSSILHFGRRVTTLARMAAWGHPTGVELHHPPRKPEHWQAVREIIAGRRFLGVVAISERLREQLLKALPGLAPERVLVAHDGVRADRVVAPVRRESSPVRAVYCGSFHRGKGVETLVAAAAQIPHVQFDLIGGEPAQIEALRSRAPSNVRLLGALPHVETQKRLPEYDIALAPYGQVVQSASSREEDNLAQWMSPLKLFEYMGAGVSIVASDLPVLRELLHDGQTALMPPPDDAAALAAAIGRLADDAGLRYRLAQAAHERLNGYTWENRAKRILDFLRAGL